MLAGGTTFGPGAKPAPKPRVVASIAVKPIGTHEAGDVVTVVGQARPLPKGDRLLVERRSGPAWIKLAECARALCSGTWTEADEVTVAFRARVVHRLAVTKGRITAVLGTSRIVTAHWTAPEPPPPPSRRLLLPRRPRPRSRASTAASTTRGGRSASTSPPTG